MEHKHDGLDERRRPSIGSRWILLGFFAVAAFFLVTEHRAHLFGFLPYAILLACPLMHMLHGHGHGSHRNHDEGNGPARGPNGEEKQ